MKRYSLWVKCLVFFLAVVTLLGVAVSALGILAAESHSMYTQDDYEEWIYDQYHDRALVIADQVILDYSGELSDCPQWILEQTGHFDAIKRVKNWYELSEEDGAKVYEAFQTIAAKNTYMLSAFDIKADL